MFVSGVISGALLYIKDEFEVVNQSSFLQVIFFWLIKRVRHMLKTGFSFLFYFSFTVMFV